MSKTIKHNLAVIATLLFVVALAVTFVMVAMPTATASAEPAEPAMGDGEVVFTTEVQGDTVRYVEVKNNAVRYVNDSVNVPTVTVTYRITSNDGFNSIFLIPEYDATVFAIDSIVINDDVTDDEVFGAATITGDTDPDYDGATKIALDKAGAKYNHEDGNNEVFLTITYVIVAAVDGDYNFGFVLAPYVERGSSIAFEYVNETENGDQERVAISVVYGNTLTLITRQDAAIEIGANNSQDTDGYDIVWDYFFVYNKAAVGVEQVDALTPAANADGFYVEYTYSGDADEEDLDIKWYLPSYQYDDVNNEYYVVADLDAELENAPSGAGNYIVVISAPETDAYYATEAYAYVHINTRNLYVTIDDKSSAYGDPLAPLTYSVGTQPYTGDTLSVTLYCDVTTSSNAGTYPITGSASFTGSYSIVFSEANYTITKKSITLTALDQSGVYTGNAFVPDQSKYTLTAGGNAIVIDGASVSIVTSDTCVNAGMYPDQLVPSINVSSTNYQVTTVCGNLTITTAGVETQVINGYFTGETFSYNQQQHNLLTVSGNLPAYYQYQVTSDNRYQTNAGSYVISITVTTDSNHHFEGNQSELVTSVTGTITPVAVTIEADDQTSSYGSAPVSTSSFGYTVTSGTVYSGDNLHVSYGGTGASVSATTAVGEYPITMTASNANYVITTNPGTYTVTKGQATAYYAEILNFKYFRMNSAEIISDVATHTAPVTQYDESYTWAKVGNQDILSTATYAVYDSDEQLVSADVVMDCATYKFVMTVPGTANYDGVVLQNYFNIYPIHVHAPVVTYDGTQVTVTPYTYPTQDAANIYGRMTDEDNWALFDEDMVVITINGVEGSTYVPTSAAPSGLSYSISAGPNYLPYEGTTVAVYSVAFADKPEDHTRNTATPANIPSDVYYVFSGQSITLPATAPTLAGYNFAGWDGNGNYYQAGATTLGITENKTMLAGWNAVNYTVNFKYVADGAVAYSANTYYYGDAVTYPTAEVAPVKASEVAGIAYEFANKWTYNDAEYSFTTSEGIATITGITVSSNMTFVAVFDEVYGVYTITYYYSETESTSAYEQYGETQSVTFGDTITYRAVPTSQVAWFAIEGWYGNEARTAGIPAVMPAQNINVYCGYKFDIGTGDVNADGLVNADDITLYRQWIVGGYLMNTIEAGEEWATVTDAEFDADAIYFLCRVADNNADEAKDIRDVSITRMSVVTGYDWDIVVGDTVSGAAIQRTKTSYNLAALQAGLSNGRARMYAAISNETADIAVNLTGSAYLDLGGYTLTVKSLAISVSGKDATITIANGTISAADGITVTAPNGNVVIEDVTAYVDGAQINLQAANNSLHFAGAVAFYNGDINDVEPEPAQVYVAENTHVVVESAATVTVAEVVVATVTEINNEIEFVAAPTKSISLDNKTNTEIEVVGVNAVAVIGNNKYESLVDAIAAVNASANGGTIVLMADIDFSTATYSSYVWPNSLSVTADNVTLDLNGHTLYNMRNAALAAGSVYAAQDRIANFTIQNGTLLAGKTNNVTNSYVMGIGGVDGATIKNVTTNGGFNVYNLSEDVVIEDCTVNGTKYYAACAQCGSHVTIKNSTFTKNTDSTVGTKAMFWIQGAGKDEDIETASNPNGEFGASSITIESGSYTVNTAEGGVFYLVGSGKMKPIVKGGTFNIDPTACLGEGSYSINDGETWFVVALEGEGTALNPYAIGTKAEIEGFRDSVNVGNNYAGKYVVLTADIVLDDGWTPIGEGSRKVVGNSTTSDKYTGTAFAGNFNGNGYTISNLNNQGFEPSAGRVVSGNYAYGLFALTDGANISNMTLYVDIDAATGDSVAALVGFSAGSLTVDSVYVYGSISAEDGVGGIVGRAYDQNVYTGNETFTVSNCYNNANVTASTSGGNKAAGIVGFVGEAPHAGSTNTITIQGCTNNGTVVGARTAGIANYSYENNNTTANTSLQNYVFSGNTDNSGAAVKYLAANGNTKNADETFSIDE